MADETKDKTHDAAWWQKQAEQFKRELDELNPRLNVAEARIRELESALQALASQAHVKQLEYAQAAQAFAVELERSREALEKQSQEVERQRCVINQMTHEAVQDSDRWERAAGEIVSLRTACAKKNAGLQACLAGVGEQLKVIQAAIEA